MTENPSFARSLAVDRTPAASAEGSIAFTANLPESWQSLRGVHGGFATALATASIAAVEPERHIRTVHAAFLRPTTVGPVDIVVTTMRRGRTLSTHRASMRQAGIDVLEVVVTLCEPTDGPDWTTTHLPRPSPVADCVPFQPPPSVRRLTHHELRLDPAHVPTSDAYDALVMGHLRPVADTELDALWLIMAGDAFPPSPFRRLVPPQGGVSIDYTVHLHRQRADTEWVEGSFLAGDSHDSLAVEHGALRTPDGIVLAETFHTRWTS